MDNFEFNKKIDVLLEKWGKDGSAQFLFALYERWKHEREYEDFKVYQEKIKETFKGVEITKVTKRPFGFRFNFQGVGLIAKVTNKGFFLQI